MKLIMLINDWNSDFEHTKRKKSELEDKNARKSG